MVEVADTPVYRMNGEEIPTLVLSCSPSFRSDYETLVSHSSSQSCAPHIAELGPIVLSDWISSLAIERLQSKSQRLHDWLELYKGNWEEVCYIVVSRSMGFGINSDAFERLARSLPLRFMQNMPILCRKSRLSCSGRRGCWPRASVPETTIMRD